MLDGGLCSSPRRHGQAASRVDTGERLGVRAMLSAMAKSRVPAEVRAYLAKIGAKGGKHASGAGGRAVWADVSAAERSKRMRDLVRKRWRKKRA
jgi:hypothetical protein